MFNERTVRTLVRMERDKKTLVRKKIFNTIKKKKFGSMRKEKVRL